ncbi:MAG: hypothetical protein QOG31_848 [Thermoplasmata archaeon]|nr:hypothetical protein [Thermoplasmata archaeon]
MWDAMGDSVMLPVRLPYDDPATDILGIWFRQENQTLSVHMEMHAYSRNSSHVVRILMDRKPDSCTNQGSLELSLGSFGSVLGALDSQGPPRASLTISRGGPPRHTCPEDHASIPFEVVDDIITWTIPASDILGSKPRVVLTVQSATASGDGSMLALPHYLSEDWLDYRALDFTLEQAAPPPPPEAPSSFHVVEAAAVPRQPVALGLLLNVATVVGLLAFAVRRTQSSR